MDVCSISCLFRISGFSVVVSKLNQYVVQVLDLEQKSLNDLRGKRYRLQPQNMLILKITALIEMFWIYSILTQINNV